MARPRMTARRPLRACVTSLASVLAAAVLTGCVLNKPPNAAEVKDLALPGLQPPAQWATGSAACWRRLGRLARRVQRR